MSVFLRHGRGAFWRGRLNRVEEHPLFRGGSLHGSAHPNGLTPLIRRFQVVPVCPLSRVYSRKLGIVDIPMPNADGTRFTAAAC